jgi:inhibitor of KinA sporulation pathway (predicted exonuclease)
MHNVDQIIEFPAVIIDTRTWETVSEFHSFVKPIKNPVLTPYCRHLTHIKQSDVDAAPQLPQVLRQFHSFLQSHRLLSSEITFEAASALRDAQLPALPYSMEFELPTSQSSAKSSSLNPSASELPPSGSSTALSALQEAWSDIVNGPAPNAFALLTDGPTDFRRFLARGCRRHRISVPFYFRRWINLKPHFRAHRGTDSRFNLEQMLESYQMQFEGRLHCGMDDTRNIARLAVALGSVDRVPLTCNGVLKTDSATADSKKMAIVRPVVAKKPANTAINVPL